MPISWDSIVSGIGTAMDFLGDNEWLVDSVMKLAIDNPELDYDQLMEMAIADAVINSPDVITPQGRSITTVDPETGKRVVEQTYSPEVQALYESLLGSAAAPVDTYRAPEGMTGPMLQKYMNAREEYFGLPLSTVERQDFGREGVTLPRGQVVDDDDEEIDPVVDEMTRTAEEELETGVDPQTGMDQRELDQFQQTLDEVERREFEAGRLPHEIDWEQAINEYVGTLEGSDPSKWQQFWIEQGDNVAGLLGGLSGIPGAGAIAKWVTGLFQDKYWETNQWQSPADIPVPDWEQDLDDSIVNDAGTWGAEQSPVNDQLVTFTRSGHSSPWVVGSDGSIQYARHGFNEEGPLYRTINIANTARKGKGG